MQVPEQSPDGNSLPAYIEAERIKPHQIISAHFTHEWEAEVAVAAFWRRFLTTGMANMFPHMTKPDIGLHQELTMQPLRTKISVEVDPDSKTKAVRATFIGNFVPLPQEAVEYLLDRDYELELDHSRKKFRNPSADEKNPEEVRAYADKIALFREHLLYDLKLPKKEVDGLSAEKVIALVQ